jgi:leucyl aminopeptidase (aminopeptidase T)
MSFSPCDEAKLAMAADFIVRDFMCVRPGEEAIITADTAADTRAVDAIYRALGVHGARATVLRFPQLPHQGALSDPYIPEAVVAAVKSCDVWFDLTFPYMGGSHAHDEALKLKRMRSLLLADLGAAGIARLFGAVDFDKLFALQNGLDALIESATGAECHVTNALGTDVRFKISKPATRKLRHTNQPGTYTPPGSAVIYPDPASVRGVIVMEAAFHEYETKLHAPCRLEVDGKIRSVGGGGSIFR